MAKAKEPTSKVQGKRKRESTSDSDLDDVEDDEAKRLLAERESKERRDKILLDAELHRAQLLKPGKYNLRHLIYDAQARNLGSHVDQATELWIMRGEFIELHTLLPKRSYHRFRDKKPGYTFSLEEGRPSFVQEDDSKELNSFAKWEEAFEIYASIYIRAHPSRANELSEYKYDIRDAASTYIWENVFDYDIEFRLHMAKHPDRDWAARLTDKYTKFMKNHIRFECNSNNYGGRQGSQTFVPSTPNSRNPKGQENCRRYNKGRCTWGKDCRYAHRCDICGKRGHGAVICRNAEKAKRNYGSDTVKAEIQSNASKSSHSHKQ